ncbi:LysR family transcriptional regulator [Thalassococcus sp. S3]|uniref:LysR family transcriptional regulator n=1 Tax=Thalassococcus sp. S3 TaxID=2017482 RepID=UPI0010246C44|nr:LysR family transcriptional regulator [Thalassococcus sp. S3]QBF33194.1 LysR family transcriptional regulator [Thalassococcus sp. S3]
MDNRLAATDWSLVQSFLAVAETGSLSAAAKRLGRSQPTLGRHIRALETHLGADLFHRHARGLTLTETARSMLPLAQAMRDAMGAFTLTAAGQTQAISGTVRVTASVVASHLVLPRLIADLRRKEPDIQIVLIPSDETENLLFREADIAVRMYRPTQLDVVTQRIGQLEIGVFAARSYLADRVPPRTIGDLLDHDLIGYDENDTILQATRDLGWPLEPEDFAVRCDNQATYWHLLRAGCGVGFGQVGIGRADPAVEEVHLDLEIPPLEVWLTAHQTLRHTPRMQRVWDHLSEGLKAICRADHDIDAGSGPG